MARINTKEKLIEYIKRSLGAPTLRVELTEEQLSDCIDDTIQRYSEWHYDGRIIGSHIVTLENNVYTYKLPDNIMEITGISSSAISSLFAQIPQGMVLDTKSIMFDTTSSFDMAGMSSTLAKFSNIKSTFNKKLNYDFNSNSKILTMLETPTHSAILLEVAKEYEPQEEDLIYNNVWIKQRAIGEAFFKWATVTGKYSTSLVSGSEISYGDMQAKGEAIIEKTDEELENNVEPFGIHVK